MKQKQNLIFATIFLISCGGGGGGGGSSSILNPAPAQPDPAPVANFDQLKAKFEGYYEYSNQWGLESVNASSAYARGLTGEGITVGVTDSGLDNSHIEISSSRLSSDSDLQYSNYKPNTRQKRHGTMVSSVIAGSQDKSSKTPIHGVAFDADLLFVAIQLAEPDDNYDPVDLGDDDGSGTVNNAPDFTGIDSFFESLFEVYNFYDVDIVNNSYGYSGNVNAYTEAQIRYAFPKTIAEMAQIDTPDSEKTIYVWAAGNAGGYDGVDFSSPELLAGMTSVISELQGHSIAVASIDPDGGISSFSNRCGIASDFCISAPGGDIVVAYATSNNDTGIYDTGDSCVLENSCYAEANGTSFAAPFVSGGLALILEHFEGQLGSTEVVSRLFATANKEGIYADKSLYGQGLMDLDAATSPVGQTNAILTPSINGPSVPAFLSNLYLTSPSFGDAISNGLADKTVIVFDELGAPFRRSLVSMSTNYQSQLTSLGNFGINDSMQTYSTKSDAEEFQLGFMKQNYSQNELVRPWHVINSTQEKNQYFTYYNASNNSFIGQGINGSWALGIFNDPDLRSKNNLKSKFSNPWLNFTAAGAAAGTSMSIGSDFGVTLALSSGRNKFSANEIFVDSNSSTVALVELRPKTNYPSLQLGLLKENDSNLGLSGSGALDGNKKQLTSFLGLSNASSFFGGKIFGSIYFGKSAGSTNNLGMIESISNLKSSSFALGFMKDSIFNLGDKIIFTIDQPLRIESGRLNLNVPVFRTKNRQVLFNSFGFDLDPSGREINTKAEYITSYKNVNLGLGIGYKSDPYHMKSMKDFMFLSMGFEISFN